MRIFSLIAHPRPNSFCHAISDRARNALSSARHEIVHHDLYAEGFQPCLTAEEAYSVGDTLEQALSRAADPTVRTHRKEIATAEGLLVVHPNWWGKPPAILSGWLDRVLVPGVAYRLASADGLPEGLLSIAKAVIFNTSDTQAEREKADFGDPLDLIWGRCVLPYCGVKAYERHILRPMVGSSDEERLTWLLNVEELSRIAF
ncbi:MAG: NAD(P)H dehydrogenase [Mesorhizobium sp.]|uniref:NAD(P)H-dependent oxidoreductase n=1 Tax=Mesorhizobium sp. TaxID=1871066 RepID=UPI000FE75FAF|nr:NAD(P)H-dependent oxidoreductase [Mesorhizobium sp.]RWB73356.1 MAG: NAD(P)H dehydrogenase [Mesorhizobium sp.]